MLRMRLFPLACAALGAFGQPNTAEYFENQVRPVLAEKCYSCHAEMNTAGLRVDSREALLKGGNRGAALVPGDAEKSLLVQVLRHTHDRVRMPPQGKLPLAQVEAIADWVRAGAYWPPKETAALRKSAEPEPTPEQKNHWAFGPLRPPPGASLDSLVRARLRKEGLTPNPPAPREVLIRRLSYDLTGLPPSPEEVARYATDPRPDATARLVDRLLASPHFGERWGRHWLDVARYGEDDYTGTQPKPYANAWRYRDWVVNAFNRDLPYDRFVKAQIAGDLLPEGERDVGGLGLFGLGPWYYGIAQPVQARADERHDRVDMVTRGFLGLTVACARCHDHKYDPVSMQDYYGLAGVFASTKYQEYPLAPPEQVAEYNAAQHRIQRAEKALDEFRDRQSEQLAEILARQAARYLLATAETTAQDAAETAARRNLDRELLERWIALAAKQDQPLLTPWQKASAADRERLAAEFQDQLLRILEDKKALDEENRILVAKAKPPRTAGRRRTILPGNYDSEDDFNPGADVPTRSLERDRYVLWRALFAPKDGVLRFDGDKIERFLHGEWRTHLDQLKREVEEARKASPPAYPYVMGVAEHEQPIDLNLNVRGNPQELGEIVPRRFLAVLGKADLRQGSGRRQLAEAVVAQPLAARVMANRIWLHLFGAGLVRTPSNFGFTGDRPAHPELLEYVAARLVAARWSMKQLIREIVLSETYQASSEPHAENARRDPDNRLWWRANRRRLDAEALRDSLLAAAGRLDGAVGGPSAELDDKLLRRSIYARVGRFRQEPTLALFDFPSASITNEQRVVTNVPLQRLFFLNSEFVMAQADALAGRLAGAGPDPEARVREAYRLLFGRAPAAEELRLGKAFAAEAGPEAWSQYAQVLFSSNEFSYLD